MKTTQHSPGPWHVHGDETQQAHYVHGANRICDIAKPSGFYRSPRETEANARLIAAAPDLLAHLQDGAFQFSRLTGPALETYARTFAVLAQRAIAKLL